MSITFKCIFSEEDRLWYFWHKNNIIFVTFIHIYRKYHISIYFLRKIIFNLPSKEKLSYFRVKKIPSLQIIQERSYSEHLEKENMVFHAVQVPSNMKSETSYSVYFRTQSECEKMRTRITPNTDTFHAVQAWFQTIIYS